MISIDNIKANFLDQYKLNIFQKDKSGVKLLEIINASFIADKPVIFGKVNNDYIERELQWYISQSLNVNDIPGEVPAIWRQVSDKDGNINSNYGWCIYSKENGNQFGSVVNELNKSPDSRRAVMIYTRPSMHIDYNINGMSDFMCTNTVQYVIRNNKLYTMVYMRSNDVVYGYKNDYAWQNYVRNQVLNSLNDKNISLGDMYWNVGSLHIYERHFKLIGEQ
jgi:thymidylate synthase